MQLTLPKSNSHKSTYRPSQSPIQLDFSLFCIVFYPKSVKFSLSQSIFFSPNGFDVGTSWLYTCFIYEGFHTKRCCRLQLYWTSFVFLLEWMLADHDKGPLQFDVHIVYSVGLQGNTQDVVLRPDNRPYAYDVTPSKKQKCAAAWGSIGLRVKAVVRNVPVAQARTRQWLWPPTWQRDDVNAEGLYHFNHQFWRSPLQDQEALLRERKLGSWGIWGY